MPNYQFMNFNKSTERKDIKGLSKIEIAVDIYTPNDNGDTEETLLRRSYLNDPKRLLTETKNPDGTPRIETLKGLIFPASELAKVIGNSEENIQSVYIEFCHHGELSGKDEFSLMITGLKENDIRVKEENGESRVYEFAQSSPPRRIAQ